MYKMDADVQETTGQKYLHLMWSDHDSQTKPKASELVPCSLLPHWNSMRFFATVSLSD